jgi:hypothetical protein
MSLILSGTDGLSDVDGTAATPAIRGTDANTGIFFPAADTIAFSEGGTESMRIDSAGNLGLGVTPSAWGANPKVIEGANGSAFTANTAAPETAIVSNAFFDGTAWKYKTTNPVSRFAVNGFDGTFTWQNAASGTAGNTATFTERMRIDSSGNLLLNTTSTTGTACMHIPATASKYSISFRGSATTSNACAFYNSGGGGVGEILIGASSTTYATTSDYRLKENIAPMIGALDVVQALKPVTYKWKTDGSDGQGFIAHELQAVVPDCVVGGKDAVNEDGSIKAQGIDTSFLVATLTAAIQELKATVDAQAARIAALESAGA